MTTKPLRIAMVAPPFYEIPPKAYGGIEAVLALLVRRAETCGVGGTRTRDRGIMS